MELDERTRQGLFQRLDDVLGPEHAEVLMSYLPPVGWADVATKRDLDVLESKLTHQFEAMLHRELGALRTELGGEIGSVRAETGSLRAEIGELRTELTKQTRGLFFALAGLMVTLSAITIAAITAT